MGQLAEDLKKLGYWIILCEKFWKREPHFLLDFLKMYLSICHNDFQIELNLGHIGLKLGHQVKWRESLANTPDIQTKFHKDRINMWSVGGLWNGITWVKTMLQIKYMKNLLNMPEATLSAQSSWKLVGMFLLVSYI